MRNTDTPIAVEGYPFIAGFAAATLLLALLGQFLHCGFFVPATLFFVLTVFTVFFFRNPERATPGDENTVVAPADGEVIFLGKVIEPHTNGEFEKISIFMSVFNVHVNRAPISGKVVDGFYTKGKFFDVRDERASFENEQQGLVLETAAGLRMVVVQVAGLIARRIVCYAKTGDSLSRGRRYGLIRFGSRLDIYLPLGTSIDVVMGQKTVAGETVLGILP
ncbi:phosphatidylserine decarboxylase, putative [Citrifermentans bemidjiense Bem]|uniref:Phosphatidylserine decarboxylase proenzyme n=1 Tax=Citrifermentans bemidjiense (strain ATCC BAA-1014 / DSM 16622 / JCM 12645 / Bem) TaxID=404380 RepID=PSD_CITBB|nr:phosphatidylserine decarboxylase family protein [Citrifermentans bemidjiense]B5EHU9.1 RecName: Full=Phosphatidylserine decarboxylase proenzyme; Contains: RecName: Full=Phosphatidylserine decarboxylase alpha chain; Contains: RecName: Full=Phosphatidylserine decarboxylase beta chain [Citrifermentans bemidjiense Bem]ACH39748.1 phosphatidylserine decarboxylase, putative [Citrifermentans bemidjiense Bem]